MHDEYLHQVGQFLGVKVLERVILEEQSDFCSVTKSVTTGIRESLERAIVGGRAEDVLLRSWVLLTLGRNGCDIDTVRDEEATVEPKTKGTDEVTGVSAVVVLGPGEEVRCS